MNFKELHRASPSQERLSGRCQDTHFGFFLKVERVDLLQLALQTEEEGGFVGLQGGLGVLERLAIGGELLRGEDWGGTQFLDELFAVFVVSERTLAASQELSHWLAATARYTPF